MKLINFEDFCRMPAGTIFAPFTPCVTEERLSIKVDEGEYDPYFKKHFFNGVMPLEPWNLNSLYSIGDQADATFEIYDGATVDYEDYKMFLVLEESDIDLMIKVLQWAKDGCVGEVPENEKTN